MVKLHLLFKADLERVATLIPSQDTRWYVKTKCSNCGEESDKWIYLSAEERSAVSGSKSEANLVVKCKGCKRESTVDIFELKDSSYTVDDSGKFKPIVGFDCRGIELVDFDPRVGWIAQGEKGTRFEVDLSSKEWTDYDDQVKEAVGIYNVQTKFEKTK